jgi:hypothetical protein
VSRPKVEKCNNKAKLQVAAVYHHTLDSNFSIVCESILVMFVVLEEPSVFLFDFTIYVFAIVASEMHSHRGDRARDRAPMNRTAQHQK